MREVPLSLNSREFLSSVLKEGLRPDAREGYDYRDIKISFGPQWGHAEVLLGRTRVLARVSTAVATPAPSRPNEGALFFNVHLSPLSSSKFSGARSDFSTVVTRLLERTIKETRVIDTECLCIVAGEKVLNLRVDITLLDFAGNVIDASCIAAMTALSHFRRPDFIVNGDEITVFSDKDRDPIPLSVLHVPITCTIGFSGEKILVDPDDEEESVMDGYVSIATNTHHEICYIYLGGGVTLTPALVSKCCEISSLKTQEISAQITKSLDEDSALRRKAGTDRPSAISSLTLQEKLDRLYVEDRTNKRENLAAEDGIENATFGSITIRYIDELDTVDEDGVAALSRPAPESVQSIPNTSQEEESFPGF
ncbi:exosome complex component RRP45-like [Bolinopsis microptera]|uniref:exosome complex component RRP45-like n=1 Tax=Bolinopsis microptera TaxID=2820187 RepID=UPI00307B0D93